MRILITGASGQVGTAMAQRLASSATVIATDRGMLDLSKPETIPSILASTAPELVINTGAYTAVDRAEQEPVLAQRVNAESPGVMAQWCARHDIPLIHFSTDYVFDGAGTRPWSEADPARPLSVYGASKLAGETRISEAGGCHLVVRTSWIYAAGGANFLSKIAALAATRKELRIVADQIGAPTSAALIAEIGANMLDDGLPMFREKATQARGLVHVTASGEASWYDFASDIVRGLRYRGVPLTVEQITPIRTEDYPVPARRPLNSRLSLRRLTEVFGITPPLWQEVLEPELDRVAQLALRSGPDVAEHRCGDD